MKFERHAQFYYSPEINRIIIINGHDGNIAPIEIAARSVKVANPEALIASLDAWWLRLRIITSRYF